MAKVEAVDLEECYAKRESDKAILVVLPDMDEAWIPKSQILDESEVYAEGHRGTLTVTKWIAEQKDISDQGNARYINT